MSPFAWFALAVFAVDAAGVAVVIRRWSRRIPKDRRRLLPLHVLAVSSFALLALGSFTALLLGWLSVAKALAGAAGVLLAVALFHLARWVEFRSVSPLGQVPDEDLRQLGITARFRWAVIGGMCVLALTNAVAVTLGFQHAADARGDLKAEGLVRANQVCGLFVRQYEEKQQQLANSERYLRGLPPEERNDAINVAVRRRLPELRMEVQASRPPDFCPAPALGP